MRTSSGLIMFAWLAQQVFGAQVPAIHTFNYTAIPGFFIQDDPATNATVVGSVPERFGLIDDSPLRWVKFEAEILKLQVEAPRGTKYKVLYVGRHGQGFHNLAEAKYGTPLWDSYWSLLNTDGNITWGPDAKLTDLGIQQAQYAESVWKTEIPHGIPLPKSLYSSPLSRAASTANITFGDILINKPSSGWFSWWWNRNGEKPLIKENLREVIGVHTCDKRSTRTYIAETYTSFNIEPGFTEDDELWTATYRETDAEKAIRLGKVLNEIFSTDPATYISITAHGGAISAIFTNVNHIPYSVSTGGVVPIVVKAVQTS